MSIVKFELCKGSNSGKAVYKIDKDGASGKRLAGGKCWGFIRTIKVFEVDLSLTDKDMNTIAEEILHGEWKNE